MDDVGTPSPTALTKREKRALAKEERREEAEKNKLKSKSKKIFFVAIIIIAILFLGYKGWQWVSTPTSSGSLNTNSNILAVKDSDWIKGEASAKVTLVEYADFECPACAVYSSEVNKIFNDNPGMVRLIYRHFPLPQHTNAVLAAQVAEAAGRQGKFWEMHDLLYEKQNDWVNEKNPLDKFKGYAKDLGLDEQKFLIDYNSKEAKDKINSDQAEGYKLKVTSTPTFYLNGKLIDLASGNVDFVSVITSALKN